MKISYGEIVNVEVIIKQKSTQRDSKVSSKGILLKSDSTSKPAIMKLES